MDAFNFLELVPHENVGKWGNNDRDIYMHARILILFIEGR